MFSGIPVLLGEGLAARSAELGLDRVKTDVIGFPQHTFDLAVTIARCESRGRVTKCIASIRVGSMGKQLFHNINVTAGYGYPESFWGSDKHFVFVRPVSSSLINPALTHIALTRGFLYLD
jgi:hypothetical protein